jgi:hypothetical protein
MKKKVVFALALFALMAVGVYAQTEADFNVSNGRIRAYSGSATVVNIPAKIKNVAITEIGPNAFMDKVNITSVVIPNGVTTIGNNAFRGCTSLTSVTIPASVTTIGEGAFSGLSKLTSITIGSGVATIGQAAFYGCTTLASVTIPASVKTIGYNVFGGCRSLTSVTFGGTIPASGFDADAFGEKNELGDIRAKYLAGGVGTYTRPNGTSTTWTKGTSAATAPAAAGSQGLKFDLTPDGKGYSVSKGTVASTIGTGDVVIPASYNNLPVTRIPDMSFIQHPIINSVIIPNSVTYIGSKSFAACGQLTSVTFQASTTATFDIDAFDGDLRAKYLAGGAGTYTRPNGTATTWTKK